MTTLSPFRRKELAAFVQDLARGDITAPSADVPFLHRDLAQLLRDHEADAARLDALESFVQDNGALVLHRGLNFTHGAAGLGLSNTGRTIRQAVDQLRGERK
jgi:hypothetical protein